MNLLLRAVLKNADTPGILAARDCFPSAGRYEPPTRRVITALAGACRILEVGAEAGHYIKAFLNKTPEAVGLAVDVFPMACCHATGRSPHLGPITADIWRRLPIAMGSLEAALCVFALRNPAGFARVLSPGRRPVVVTPDRDHPVELRESLGLLGLDPEKLERLDGPVTSFDLVDRQELTHPLSLSVEAATDLVAMGPNVFCTYKAPIAARTTVVFTTSTFRQL